MPYLPLVLIFSLFLITLHPSITAGDSGEIVAAGFSLGIPHPPGYPLHATVGKLFILLLPLGSVAYRMNMVSAIFGALSCGMVYSITSKIVGAGLAPAQEGQPQGLPLRLTSYISHLPAFFAAASLALSYEFWYRSTVAEVYTLNAFLMLLIIYILLVWREKIRGQWPVVSGREMLNTSHDSRLLYLASFLLGLGIGNHHTIVLIVPGAAVFVLLGSRGQGVKGFILTRTLLCLTFFFLLGLSIYLYLPIRSAQNPFMDWGDPQVINNFIDVFTRRTYLPEVVGREWGTFVGQLKTFNPVHEFTIIGSVFGLIGVYGLWSSDKAAATMILLIFILTSYGLIFLAGPSATDLLRKFYLPAYAVFSVFIGTGIFAGLKLLEGGRISTSQLLNLPTSMVYLLATVSLIWQFSAHYPRTQSSGNYLAYDYGMNELNSLHEGATYISKGEVKTFPLWYLQGVEGYREDVNVVTAYFLTQRWYLREVLKIAGVPREIPQDLTYKQMLIDAIYKRNADKGVYTGFLDEEYIPANLLTYTQGITFQLYKKPEERASKDIWPFYQLRGVKKIEDSMEMGTLEILKDYASSHYNTGLEYYDEGDVDRAITEFENALAINPDEADSLNNLAALYAKKGIRLKEAEGMAKKAFGLYTGEKDKEMAKETIEEIGEKMKDSI